MKYPYIFFGSPPIGNIALEALQKAYYPPVHVVDNPKMSLDEQLLIVEEFKPTFLLVAGFGAILKRDLLDTVAGQVLNIHPSLLPNYRGPAPVVQAILDDASETGVSLMEIDTLMDHGPILAQSTHRLRGNEYPDELYAVLTQRGVELFLENIDDYLEERLEPTAQDETLATFTHFVKKDDGILNLGDDPHLNERKVRAYQGWPRAYVMYKDKRLLIDKAHIEGDQLRFDIVQLEGKKAMPLVEFLNGIRLDEEKFYQTLRTD